MVGSGRLTEADLARSFEIAVLSNCSERILAADVPLQLFSVNVVPDAWIFSANLVREIRCNRFLRFMLSGRYS